MHNIKNKKLLSIFMSGMISYACLGIDDIYANENSNKVEMDSNVEGTNGTTKEDNNTDNSETEDKDENNSEEKLKEILVNDINNADNIGLNIKTQGNITKIEDNKIYIKDESGEGIVYLEDISVNNLKVGDCISVIGIVNQMENQNVIIVSDINSIGLIINEENSSEDEDKDKDNPNKDENKEDGKKNESSKPNKQSNSQSTSKQSSKVSTSKLDKEEVTINSIKAKDAVVIENDLTSAQWNKVKLNLEEKKIKVKDLKHNKIRITQVNNESGDNIWIVNDPRMLDLEEVKTIGTEITHTIVYSEYDVSESKWKSIVKDVESGSAKIKYDSGKNIKVIYKNGNGKDGIITLKKI